MEASALLPQSGDCWNVDRSICHPLPSRTHLLSKGPTLSIFLPLSLLTAASQSCLGTTVKLLEAPQRNPINYTLSRAPIPSSQELISGKFLLNMTAVILF